MWIEQGGLMTWPLLALSVIVFAVLIDRGIAFSTLSLPNAEEEANLLDALRHNKTEEALKTTRESFPVLVPLVGVLASDDLALVRETASAIRVEEVVRGLDKRVGILALASRVAPLMGLLGTIIGIIVTFNHVATGRGAVDMSSLAEGIWQALIATAIGLCIAIPSVLIHHAFVKREEAVTFALTRFANLALARKNAEKAA